MQAENVQTYRGGTERGRETRRPIKITSQEKNTGMARAKAVKEQPEQIKETAEFQLIAIGHLNPSPTNPRKRFPEASLKELAESIKEHGLLQHILVRASGKKGYEIVCGERRYRRGKAGRPERDPVYYP